MQRLFALLLLFGSKKVALKSSFIDLYFHSFIIEFRIEEKLHTKAVADVSGVARRRFSQFPLERLRVG